jgi:hypothetical protein
MLVILDSRGGIKIDLQIVMIRLTGGNVGNLVD